MGGEAFPNTFRYVNRLVCPSPVYADVPHLHLNLASFLAWGCAEHNVTRFVHASVLPRTSGVVAHSRSNHDVVKASAELARELLARTGDCVCLVDLSST